ncbi:MAG: hypothetical protein PHQ03_09040 [Methylococcales bacterium]|nr:hypothetical protein [Methylococcales bacterium]
MNRMSIIFAMLLSFGCVKESFSEIKTDKGIEYKVVKDEKLGNIKRMVDVVLSEKISEEELKKIAMEIKHSDSKNYDKTFITYSLSADKKFTKDRNRDGWATTHFNPNLEVKIQGLNLKDEQTLLAKANTATDANRKVIGSWIDDRIGYTAVLFKADKKLFMEKLFYDGSGSVDEMMIDKNKKITSKVDYGHGEYYVINAKKELESWGRNGLIYTSRELPRK